MDIDSRLLQEYPLNEQQKAILKHEDGPLLVIAGPGTGKTLTLILRAMNLLIHAKAKPSEIILCTYTDKAAHEMHDRIMTLARKIDYQEDPSELRVGTFHKKCTVETRLLSRDGRKQRCPQASSFRDVPLAGKREKCGLPFG